MMFCTLLTKVWQSVPECEIGWYNTEKCARVLNSATQYGISAKSSGGYQQCLLIGNNYQKVLYKLFCILLGFDYFDEGVSIYLWHRLLMLIVGTTSIILMDGTKQAGLVVIIG